MNKPRSTAAARIRPSRKPKLKVFGQEPTHDRHLMLFTASINNGVPVRSSVEIWTEAEWKSLLPWERETLNAAHVPGIGWVAVCTGLSEADYSDLRSVLEQSMA